MPTQAGQLVLLSKAKAALAEAKTLDEVKVIRDKAEAIRMYAKAQNECLEIQNQAAEVKLRAERKAGGMLSGMSINGGDRKSVRHGDILNLEDMGLNHNQSARWQRVASVPEKKFEQHVFDTIDAGKELTTASVLTLAKVHKNASRNAETLNQTESVESLDGLVAAERKFACVYADPPWQYGNQATRASTDNHYPTMPTDAIAALPIAQLVADDAHLHLWTTNGFLFESKRIIEAWGFEYKSMRIWVKPQMGIGNYWRVSHEILLFGVRGSCPFLDRGMMSWLQADRGRHSAKPHQFRADIEKVSPGPRLELFGRSTVPDWTVWGNQVSKSIFDTEVVA